MSLAQRGLRIVQLYLLNPAAIQCESFLNCLCDDCRKIFSSLEASGKSERGLWICSLHPQKHKYSQS